MELLSPEKIQDDKKNRVTDQIERSQEAATEETRITRELNETREREKIETERIKAEREAEIKPLEERKLELTSRVKSLEERRLEALKPIKHLEKQAEEHMMTAKKRHDEADSRETALRTKEDELDVRMDDVATVREELRAREERIKKREEGLEVAEIVSRSSASDLAEKWVAYHNAITINNTSFMDKELRIAERESKCKIWEESLGVKEREQMDNDTNIKSRYKALEDAEARTKQTQ